MGVNRLSSDNGARAEGFKALEMAATMAGVPFFKKCGYHIESGWEDTNGAVAVPLCTMVKIIS